jgi:RecA-family ATPase
MELEKQNAIMRELELPIAVLVYSGKKSIHAIVKVDAANYEEYRKRVDYLYDVCKKNGLNIDSQNRNPSRLSRMPGVERNGKKQFIIDTNIGKSNWEDWHEWIEGINDDLPDPESLTDYWDHLPELAPPLIQGVLRQGHKMLMAGPSKAGKSFALIELSIAIAEGAKWIAWQCSKGKVLYVNLELDRASALHRFKDVYQALGLPPNNLNNIDIWNLRGKSVPMDKLAPKLIRRAQKKNYIAIIIDPIYKVITGDENSADQMANFCNQFDKVCAELGAAVIYCHHHSKGVQGQKKSMDRASGSGVFARDPDVLLDLIELELPEKLLKQEENKAVCKVCEAWLGRHVEAWTDDVSQDDMCSEKAMLGACKLSERENSCAR